MKNKEFATERGESRPSRRNRRASRLIRSTPETAAAAEMGLKPQLPDYGTTDIALPQSLIVSSKSTSTKARIRSVAPLSSKQMGCGNLTVCPEDIQRSAVDVKAVRGLAGSGGGRDVPDLTIGAVDDLEVVRSLLALG